CTLRLNRRRALSIDSPSWIFTSATRLTPPSRVAIHANMLGYHSDRRILGAIPVNVNEITSDAAARHAAGSLALTWPSYESSGARERRARARARRPAHCRP